MSLSIAPGVSQRYRRVAEGESRSSVRLPRKADTDNASLSYERWTQNPLHRAAMVLTVLAGALTAIALPRAGNGSWSFFAKAAGLSARHNRKTGAFEGWHLYANYPKAQFGPVSVLAAKAAILVGHGRGVRVAQLFAMFTYVCIVWLIAGAAQRSSVQAARQRVARVLLISGLVLLPVWFQLAVVNIHLDDVLALFNAVLAVWAITAKRPYLAALALGIAALALGIAADAKPWAVMFLVLLLAIESKDRWMAFGIAWAVAFLPWISTRRATRRLLRFVGQVRFTGFAFAQHHGFGLSCFRHQQPIGSKRVTPNRLAIHWKHEGWTKNVWTLRVGSIKGRVVGTHPYDCVVRSSGRLASWPGPTFRLKLLTT